MSFGASASFYHEAFNLERLRRRRGRAIAARTYRKRWHNYPGPSAPGVASCPGIRRREQKPRPKHHTNIF
eukprot:136631-Pyramimonas_sp.AAC.1